MLNNCSVSKTWLTKKPVWNFPADSYLFLLITTGQQNSQAPFTVELPSGGIMSQRRWFTEPPRPFVGSPGTHEERKERVPQIHTDGACEFRNTKLLWILSLL